MHLPALIHDLAIMLAVASIITLIFRKLKQPIVLGYIVAGMIVGPYTPPNPFIRDTPNIAVWGELGVIFLMFALGLHFSFRKLTRVGLPATSTALFEVATMFLLGTLAGRSMGLSQMDALFIGGMLSISSTTIILRALDELKLGTRHFAEVVFGVLIIEDLVAILLIVGLSTVALTESFVSSEILFAAIKLFFIVGSWFIVGYFFIPTFLRFTGQHLDDEALLVLSTSLCLGLVVVAAHFGYSAALGAFIMGSILAETRESPRIDRLLHSVKMLFAAVFFISVGMLVDPKVLVQHWDTILLLTVITVGGKIVSSTFGALVAGETPANALRIGFSLAQIGEFSFIIVGVGQTLGVISDFLYPVAVAVSVVTTFLTPYLVRMSEPLGIWVETKLPEEVMQSLHRRAASLKSGMRVEYQVFLRQSMRFLANAIATTLVFLAASQYVLPRAEAMTSSPAIASFAAWGIAIFFSAPFVWGMFFAFRHRDKKGQESTQGYAGVTPFFGHLGCIVWIGALSDLFFATTLALAVTLLTSLVLFFLFYQRLEKSYSKIEARFLSNIAGQDDDTTLRRLAPWDLHLVRVEIHPNSAIAGKSLREVDPRNRFKLNVVAIERGEKTTSPPTADDALLPKDNVLVLGEDEGIDRFRQQASESAIPRNEHLTLEDFRIRREVVTAESPYRDKSIRESRIREQSGSVLVGLERDGHRYLNPKPELELRLGDTLWLVGRTA